VTSRVLAIFDAFDIEHPQLTLSDISRRCGLPLATTHRLIAELVAWRGLERDQHGMYHVGLRLWEVGLLCPLHTRLREVAMPFLQSLYEATRENVHLAVRDGFDALYVEKLSGHRSVPIISRIGGRLPMHTTGVGKALLAHESPDFVEEYVSRPLERPTRYTIAEPGRLLRDLANTRRRGYAVTREEMTLGSCSVAVPVLDEEAVRLPRSVLSYTRFGWSRTDSPRRSGSRPKASLLALWPLATIRTRATCTTTPGFDAAPVAPDASGVVAVNSLCDAAGLVGSVALDHEVDDDLHAISRNVLHGGEGGSQADLRVDRYGLRKPNLVEAVVHLGRDAFDLQ
jgi:DNA-binding IclR family transcriptional regulator